MPDQTKQKIESFVEKEDDFSCERTHESALRRAIIFGLELGKEAGPKKQELHDEDQSCRQDLRCAGCREKKAANLVLSKKNSAIQVLIDGMKL